MDNDEQNNAKLEQMAALEKSVKMDDGPITGITSTIEEEEDFAKTILTQIEGATQQDLDKPPPRKKGKKKVVKKKVVKRVVKKKPASSSGSSSGSGTSSSGSDSDSGSSSSSANKKAVSKKAPSKKAPS